jgi:hypothetical protein
LEVPVDDLTVLAIVVASVVLAAGACFAVVAYAVHRDRRRPR